MDKVVKDIILEPMVPEDKIIEYVKNAIEEGASSFLCSPESVSIIKDVSKDAVTISASWEADIIVADSIEELRHILDSGKRGALSLKIKDSADIDYALAASRLGASMILVDTADWRIIPLENLIAGLHKQNTRLYARAKAVEEVRTLFGVLERGVDGVLLESARLDDIKAVTAMISGGKQIELKLAKIVKVKDVGLGERVCIDTASILSIGEGMLVGGRSGFFFLVHNESVGSQFTSPRPFRVNAGTIQNYVLMPDGKTKYLSEIEAGDDVLVVNHQGKTRIAVVGRVKIERRPLKLVKAESEGVEGTILVQNAETIRFVGRDGSLLSVTELKEGDEVSVNVSGVEGRHFGLEVEEFILEK